MGVGGVGKELYYCHKHLKAARTDSRQLSKSAPPNEHLHKLQLYILLSLTLESPTVRFLKTSSLECRQIEALAYNLDSSSLCLSCLLFGIA